MNAPFLSVTEPSKPPRALKTHYARSLGPALLALWLPSCGVLSKLSDVGHPPEMSKPADPTTDPAWHPMSLPMPSAEFTAPQANSLWRTGSRAFFKDQRAAQVGDLVTIVVNMADTAVMADQTLADRTGAQTEGAPSILGLQASIPHLFGGSSASSLVSTSNAGTMTGTGTINRSETVTLRLAGEVVQRMPNGNLVVAAKQEVRVNSELRELAVTGIVRPQDIASDNTVTHDRMAEARISYGGRGTLTNVQTPRWGEQVLEAILPF
jgi:flagellar L-ring protein precursor FlgH